MMGEHQKNCAVGGLLGNVGSDSCFVSGDNGSLQDDFCLVCVVKSQRVLLILFAATSHEFLLFQTVY
jgi:hypothetical protein